MKLVVEKIRYKVHKQSNTKVYNRVWDQIYDQVRSKVEIPTYNLLYFSVDRELKVELK